MKAMLVLISAILIIVWLMLFWSADKSTFDNANKTPSEIKNTESFVNEAQTDVSISEVSTTRDDAERVARMKAEYQLLEKSRKTLKRRLSRLKHEMWGLKFPPREAKQISEIMLSSYKLLKDPDLLGAFSNVAAIQDENAKVDFANKSLDIVDEMIEENKKRE